LGVPSPDDDTVTTFDAVKRLPYLQAVIDESLRLHSTSAIGLPRIVPDGAPLAAAGHAWVPGTVLSVPSFSIHRDQEVWGADADAFRPERWFEEERKDVMQRTFNPFSFGPRACVGRNLASMELLLIVSSVFRRYHIVLEEPEKEVSGVGIHVWRSYANHLPSQLETAEGFLRKPLQCQIGIKRRHV
jgi:benzoate 4-monooxygenase